MDWDDYSKQFERAAANAGRSPEFAQRWLAYAKILSDRGLPIIYDVEHLCALLGTDYDVLSKALSDLGEFYVSYRIPKRTFGYRAIDEPNDSLRAIHLWVKTEILDRCTPDAAAMAFVRGRSIKHNALPHVRQQMVLSLDLKNFFPSVSQKMVLAVFQGMGYASDVSATLAALTTLRNGLPQGAATSPPLSNLVMRSFDAELSSCASALGLAYTRYADDITFSGRFQPGHLIWRVRRAARQMGLTVNESKTRLMLRHERQEVTGIVVNDHLQAPRNVRRQLRQELHYCKKFGVEDHLERKSPLFANRLEYLLGVSEHVRFVNPNDRDAMALRRALGPVRFAPNRKP